jgi:hypothetical protein
MAGLSCRFVREVKAEIVFGNSRESSPQCTDKQDQVKELLKCDGVFEGLEVKRLV